MENRIVQINETDYERTTIGELIGNVIDNPYIVKVSEK